MRGARTFCLGLMLGTGPVAAEDFTGFYAGVNAGWAFERGRDATAPLPPTGADRNEPGLPPSVVRIERQRRSETPAERGR
ncbi:hypothetical protein ASG52_05005 [Methylobacterium sp. Leaf456]|uniref:hypothetical protein n=1 Tax=Methylobacterium sp. Leaf456 TaxID=1736382 RepID=UPI0006FF99F6|nr:hypothetical protein [Methylobacterium sp. Leaf456]KQT53478.1 hypothetical protein ASG52_05005 [Methylobacterium sp. Leaf456]